MRLLLKFLRLFSLRFIMAILTSELLPSLGVSTVLKGGVALLASYILVSIVQAVYGAYFGPLSKFP